MNTCPKCGAAELKSDRTVICGDLPRYACGTTFRGFDGTLCLAKQLDAANREVIALRKWKATVMENAAITNEDVDLQEFIEIGCGQFVGCSFFIGRVHSEGAAEAFDHAVRKAMEG